MFRVGLSVAQNQFRRRPRRRLLPLQRRPNGSSSTKDKEEESTFAFWTNTAVHLVVTVSTVFCFTEYIMDITLCEGPSMLPTLNSSGEIILLDKCSYRFFGMSDGYIGEARVESAKKRQEEYEASLGKEETKFWHEHRIPVSDLQLRQPLSWYGAFQHVISPISVGDVIVVDHPRRKGTVCKRVLGLPGDQVLCTRHRSQRHQLQTVPTGHIWLEGDNPANSSDSRDYGPIPASLIVGRVMARIWPLRGKAWMMRGAPPPSKDGYPSTVLPAGYEGQPIQKSVASKMI